MKSILYFIFYILSSISISLAEQHTMNGNREVTYDDCVRELKQYPNYRNSSRYDDVGNIIHTTHLIGNIGVLNTYYKDGDYIGGEYLEVTQLPFNFEMLVEKLKTHFNFDLELQKAVFIDSIVLQDFDYSWGDPDGDTFVYSIILPIEGSHKRRYIKINFISGNVIEDEVL